MIRLTTPIHKFIFNSDPNEYSRILITYAQGNSIILEKEREDLEIDERYDEATEETKWDVWFRMTQQETKKFSASGPPVKVQVRVLTSDGVAMASEKRSLSVDDVLNDEVLT